MLLLLITQSKYKCHIPILPFSEHLKEIAVLAALYNFQIRFAVIFTWFNWKFYISIIFVYVFCWRIMFRSKTVLSDF